MKKNLATILLAATVFAGTTVYVATPVQPERYELHTVQYGETFEGIIKDANQNSDVNYDIRNAVSIAVSESNKIEGGAISRQLKVGDKVVVPIYRH